MKVLNLYSGLGGNRKNWKDVDVTAVEFNQEIANIYQTFFPNDIVIVADAHKYLEEHYQEFDFIWSSPPCQTHSKVRMMASKGGSYPPLMPDMTLWSEIIFLQTFSKCPWVVENVKPYYKPFIEPSIKLGRHYIWSNFNIPYIDLKDGLNHNERGTHDKGFFDLREFKTKHRKDQLIRNCVDPKLGEYILNVCQRI